MPKLAGINSLDIIFLDNPYRQLVTLEVNGKMVIDYQTTKNKIQEKNRSDYIFNFILVIFHIAMLCFWFKTMKNL